MILYFNNDEEPNNLWKQGRVCRVVRKIESKFYAGDAYKALRRASVGDVLMIIGLEWRQLK